MIRPRKPVANCNSDALPLADCLAKTCVLENGVVKAGIDVTGHCLIVGRVAQEVISRFPAWYKEKLFPGGFDLVAAAHDVGKICPTFQEKLRRAIDGYVANSVPELANANPDIERQWGGHAGVSQASVTDAGRLIPYILGRHHGYTPNPTYLADDGVFGGESWQSRRQEFLEYLKTATGSGWPEIPGEEIASLLAGLTTVADWIGSGSLFDPVLPDGQKAVPWETQISHAVDIAGFLRPQIRKGLDFEDVFKWNPRPIQTALFEAVAGSGVYVLEAPMGLGKTEAALYAAYSILEKDLATGIYFALPTQLTSDKIHERMNSFLASVLEPDCPYKSSLLLHGNAWLNEATELGEDCLPGRSWYTSTKRAILAPFAVGTIDQALMAVMNVRHGFVRSFGLAGKIVILDEVHTYDSYTGTILDKLVHALQEMHCTVIILTATLTDERLRSILGLVSGLKTSPAYPLITAVSRDGGLSQTHVLDGDEARVMLRMERDDSCATDEVLKRAENGQQILWIENTVAEAQERFRILAARCSGTPVDCGLLHARFLKTDRQKNEDLWVSLFGKDGHSTRRSKGRILVGTQVLEQSLDIDADFLVTRICPTDMLLQRIGRLWRHRVNDPVRPADAVRETWILAPRLEEAIADPLKAFGSTARVYAPYVLIRTMEAWESRGSITLPDDIRSFLENTYAVREDEEPVSKYRLQLEREREKLERFARIGLSTAGKTLPESKASTRYSEMETCEVLLLLGKKETADGTMVTFRDGTAVVLPRLPRKNGIKNWKKLAALIALNTVQVPVFRAPDPLPKSMLGWLREYAWLGYDDEDGDPFRVAVIAEAGTLHSPRGGEASSKYRLGYDMMQGYWAKKRS